MKIGNKIEIDDFTLVIIIGLLLVGIIEILKLV